MWLQKQLNLMAKPRGFHLITAEVLAQLPEIRSVRVGLLHLMLMHTSASLSINENADPDVRADLEKCLSRLIPDGASYFAHTLEGPDDMPAHVKASLLGCQLSLPVRDGELVLGTWQGIYLGEHRQHATRRSLVLTLWGESGID